MNNFFINISVSMLKISDNSAIGSMIISHIRSDIVRLGASFCDA